MHSIIMQAGESGFHAAFAKPHDLPSNPRVDADSNLLEDY